MKKYTKTIVRTYFMKCCMVFFILCSLTLDAQNSWDRFLNENDSWHFVFDDNSGNIHKAYGKSIQIEGFSTIDKNNAATACYAFMDSYPELFDFPKDQIVLNNVHSVNKKYFIQFKQVIDGIPVQDSELSFIVYETGKLMSFGIEWANVAEGYRYRLTSYSNATLRHRLTSRYSTSRFDISAVRSECYYPVYNGNDVTLRLCRKFDVISKDKSEAYKVYVNTSNGEVLRTIDQVFDFDKKIEGSIKPQYYTDANANKGMPFLSVNVNGVDYVTNSSGVIENLPDASSYSYTTSFIGTYARIENVTPVSGTFTNEANSLLLDDSNQARERNLFYHLNKGRDIITTLDPEFTAINICFPASVVEDSHCNAYYSRRTDVGEPGRFYFFTAGTVNGYTCNEFSLAPGVIYHEYGHAINDYVFFQLNHDEGMNNVTCHEGMADVFAALILDNHIMLPDIYTSGGEDRIRYLDNTLRYPEDYNGLDGHYSGQILSGAFWDLKKVIGTEKVQRLSHFAKYSLPDDVDIRLAFSEWFLATLIADDDDGDLSTPSENQQAIIDAFNKHGIGSDLYLKTSFSHTQIANSDNDSTPYNGEFTVSSPNGVLDVEHISIIYSNNNFTTQNTIKPTFADGKYIFSIPSHAKGSFIKYYFQIHDPVTEENIVFPEGYPDTKPPYKFLIGFEDVFTDDFSTDKGWTIENKADSQGPWIIGIPEKEEMQDGNIIWVLQPSEDHTTGDGKCLYTGNDDKYNSDGDIAISPMFDCSDYATVVVSYYDWFFAHKNSGAYKLFVSGDNGNNWHLMENKRPGRHVWKNQFYNVGDYLQAGSFSQLKFKIETESHGGPYNVLIDDFSILGSPRCSSIDELLFNANIQLEVYPNPTKGISNVSLKGCNKHEVKIHLYDMYGRLVEVIFNEVYNGNEKLLLDLSNYPSAVYYLKAVVEGKYKKSIKVVR
ncbi:MAG: T9SS type A sorting domain-containing protein [Hyphomicrobiales bacterium]